MKSWLAQGSSGRRVTLLPGTTFLDINGALVNCPFQKRAGEWGEFRFAKPSGIVTRDRV